MHYFVFLRLSGFYAQVLDRRPGNLHAKPLIVHRDKRVLDVDEAAQTRQIYRGMPLAEAKAILHDGAFVSWEEEPYRQAQGEWLDPCAEFSDVIEPDEQHSAWIDLSLHPNPQALAESLRRRVEEATGLRATLGIGWSKWIAKLATQLANTQYPIPDTLTFLHSLKTRHLSPVDLEHLARLEFLGYATIGEVAKVPFEVLRAQFGEAATHIRMCARGGYFEPVAAVYPPNSISERVPFEGSVEDLPTLDLALRDLAASLSKRLSQEDKQGKELVVTLEVDAGGNHEGDKGTTAHEGASCVVRRRKFTKPIQNYASALASLRLLLTPPPEEPILGIRARLENVTEAKRIQRELTGHTTTADRERGALAAFQHIRTVFGDASIVTGCDIVEPRRKQVLRAWKDATGWR
ncbi:MAG TPA: hypothetical protein VMI31_12215 [Fimbriimonadaceae bacterium]|nr:hypothetical protein [Fimbriimonadaceae bacterium]